jgi:hypothetical protein
MAMIRDGNEEASHVKIRKHTIESSSDNETKEEKMTKEGFYRFGTAFCLLGAVLNNGPSTILGGFFCFRGWMAPDTDHFD